MTGLVDIVDDEEAIRDALAFLLASRDIETRLWASGEDFLAAQPLEDMTCIIMDVRMGACRGPRSMNGCIPWARWCR
ncbi:response regulator [Gemmobacter sp. 24YEA27]|uniref:response regulator n=1 Tax=Gemmobacter sp. 24YEA27 TaxID=3040672 RepID=UPI0024B34351|nr:response regulator [Gemmobacter sp. 24YEA27]